MRPKEGTMILLIIFKDICFNGSGEGYVSYFDCYGDSIISMDRRTYRPQKDGQTLI